MPAAQAKAEASQQNGAEMGLWCCFDRVFFKQVHELDKSETGRMSCDKTNVEPTRLHARCRLQIAITPQSVNTWFAASG